MLIQGIYQEGEKLMTPQLTGVVSILLLFILIMLGCPIGLAMVIVGAGGFAAIIGIEPAINILETGAFETASNYSLTLIPLFLLMGNLISQSGLSKDLFLAARKFTGGWNGGLAIAGLTSSAAFSAVSGSSLATAATMTKVAYPEMMSHGYDKRLAAGSLAAGGTLGIMIPPSIALLLYALITEQSVREMFLAGFLPGLLAYSLYLITIIIMARLWRPGNNNQTTQETGSVALAMRRISPIFVLFGLVMGGLYGGFFTPTEAGGAGAALALFFFFWKRRKDSHKWIRLKESLQETVRMSATIFLILIGAEIFGYLLSVSQVSFEMINYIHQHHFTPWQILASILLFYIVMGFFMESLSMILLTVPIFFPLIIEAGFNPVWFGILIVVTVEMGLLTPPVGMNIFVVKDAAKDLELKDVVKGVMPFFIADLIRLAILIAFPSIALYLTAS